MLAKQKHLYGVKTQHYTESWTRWVLFNYGDIKVLGGDNFIIVAYVDDIVQICCHGMLIK